MTQAQTRTRAATLIAQNERVSRKRNAEGANIVLVNLNSRVNLPQKGEGREEADCACENPKRRRENGTVTKVEQC